MNKKSTSDPKSSSKTDDSGLSKNYSKSVKFRLRVQQAKEADKLIKEFKDDKNRTD